MKYEAMAADAFAFFRGTCHLFWEDWSHPDLLDHAPRAWVCGDLHLENFGTFKGDNRLTYFDVNDFDEAALAPCTYDPARLTTSILLAAESLGLKGKRLLDLCRAFVDAYAGALGAGTARWVERPTASGMVGKLLDGLKDRTRLALLNKRTYRKGRRRRILVDGDRALEADDSDRAKVERLLRRLPAADGRGSAFFKVRDVARRISGLGSLGVERYVILVEGKGSPDRNYLLDLKRARPTALRLALRGRPSGFVNEALRVVTTQRRMLAIPPALLHALDDDGESFVLRELEPREDRLRLETASGRRKRLEEVVCTMGNLTAWDQLRASGRQGAAVADDLIAFAQDRRWRAGIVDYARAYAARVTRDHRVFSRAWRRGYFAAQTSRVIGRS